ncbi:MAG: hypothetical protein BroJett026_24170 [Betaproteobacteria bacterium]|nr:MAG: hypothetical protein BroJett026_24170 [Betaproteobacteria bacterium]
MLGMWLFAQFVGIANACLPGQPVGKHPAGHGTMVVVAHHSDDVAPPECVSFCTEDAPLFAKLQLVPDQPAGQAFVVAMQPFVLLARPGVRIAPTPLAHPPPGVPLYLRSLRLVL